MIKKLTAYLLHSFLDLYKPLNQGYRRIILIIALFILLFQLYAAMDFLLGSADFEDFFYQVILIQPIYWSIVYIILWVREGFITKKEA
jgi:hypothetical protein